MKRKLELLIVFMLSVAAIMGATTCQGSSPAPASSALSPLPAQASPLGGPEVALRGLSFNLDEPLQEGAVQVSGTGPIGVEVLVVDITLMGESLGRGIIDPDGRFDISIAPPLILNHRIGLTLYGAGEQAVAYTDEFLHQLDAFRGDGAIAVPNVGFMYDAASVKP